MRNFFTSVAVLLLSLNVCSQNCKYDRNDFDKFTKKQKIEKEVKVSGAGFYGDSYLVLNFCKYDTNTFFRITWIRKTAMVVGENDALMFLFEDGETVKAFPLDIYSSKYRSSTDQEVLSAAYLFEIENNYKKLLEKKITSIRINFNQVYKDVEAEKKFQDNIIEAAKCVFQ